MTTQEMERAIEFLLEHHAKFSVDIEQLKDVQRQQGENLDRLTADVQALTAGVDAMREEMRDGFDKLILANEVTRKLSEDVARLALQTAQLVTALESKPDGQ